MSTAGFRCLALLARASTYTHALSLSLSRLVSLPPQNFKFSVTRMGLHDNPSLAAALAAATRTTLQEVPSSEDFFDCEAEKHP